jgi:hypothetical protein
MVHLLGAGIWVGGLPPLALLLYAASRCASTPDPYAVRAMQRFSRVALITVLVLAGSGIATALLSFGRVFTPGAQDRAQDSLGAHRKHATGVVAPYARHLFPKQVGGFSARPEVPNAPGPAH